MAHTKDSIQSLLLTSDKALARGVVAIYRRQTQDEQHAQAAIHENGVGFTGTDARFLSMVARTVLAHGEIHPGHIHATRAMMPKYWRQLLDIALAREAQATLKSLGIE